MSIPHYWTSALVLWLVFISNLTTVLGMEPVSPQAILLSVSASVLALIGGCRYRVRPGYAIATTLMAHLVLKGINGEPLLGSHFVHLGLESFIITISVYLASHTGLVLGELEETVAHLAGLKMPISFTEMEPEFYQEVRRARRFGRPVSLLAVRPTGKTMAQMEQQLREELLTKLAREYTDAQFAKLLSAGMGDCDLLAKSDENFLILLPESDKEAAYQIAAELAQQCKELGGGNLMVGISDFPNNELTLSGMIKAAESQLKLFSAGHSASRSDGAHGTAPLAPAAAAGQSAEDTVTPNRDSRELVEA